jgi:hypothetical protein
MELTLDDVTDEYVVTKQFKNQNEFSLYIEDRSRINKTTYLEAVIQYCNESSIDPEAIKSLIGPQLKDRIRIDAEESNLMKKRTSLEF